MDCCRTVYILAASSSTPTHRIQRRVYRADYADQSWHTDMNLKLVDYGLFWTMCVDGYSRLVLWLEPVVDRRATTVWAPFAAVARVRGLPDQLVSDHGAENRLMGLACWLFHVSLAPEERPERAPHRGVSSVRNTRVERTWGEVNDKINRLIRCFGFFLEGSVGFDPSDSVQLGAFHRLVLPAMKYLGDMMMAARNSRRVQASRGNPGSGGQGLT